MQRGGKTGCPAFETFCFLISSESTERERLLDFGSLTPLHAGAAESDYNLLARLVRDGWSEGTHEGN